MIPLHVQMGLAERYARVLTSHTPVETLERAPAAEHEPEPESGDWFCVATDPFPCPGPECDFVALHMTAMHLVIVWAEKDDPDLLYHATRAQQVGRNPHIVEYEPSFGPCIPFHRLMGLLPSGDAPVHGIKKER